MPGGYDTYEEWTASLVGEGYSPADAKALTDAHAVNAALWARGAPAGTTPALITGITVAPGASAIGVSGGVVSIVRPDDSATVQAIQAAAIAARGNGGTRPPVVTAVAEAAPVAPALEIATENENMVTQLYDPRGVDYAAYGPNWGKIGRAALGAAVGFVTGGPAGAVVGAGKVLLSNGKNGGGGGGGSQIGTTLTGGPCPVGWVRQGTACVPAGPSWQGPISSGPDTGLTPASGLAMQPTLGYFGVGWTPTQVGVISGHPILRCAYGGVLGKDNICYQSLPAKNRKWRPAKRPPMTGAESAALKSIGTLRKKARKLAGLAGYTCATRGSSRSAPKRRK